MVKNPRTPAPSLSLCMVLLLGLGGETLLPLCAQPFMALPPEAATSLMEAELGGSDAELLVKGSWELSLLSKLSLALPPEGGLRLGEAQPLLFQQSPDLLLSFLLFERWFVEARVSPDASQVRYVAGYRGGPNETLREFRIGNVGISFPVLPFISFGEGSARSFGLAASAESGGFQGRAMLRYDQADRVVKAYLGRSELSETIIAASSFIRGRWFQTPSFPASNLVLYVESAAGTLQGPLGAKFRRLEASEYSYSATSGFIALGKAVETRLAADYDLDGGSFNIDGTDCVLLFDPEHREPNGDLDPGRQILSRYPVAGAVDEVFVRDRASGGRDEAYLARYDPAGFVEVQRGASPTELEIRQPFIGDIPELYTRDFEAEDSTFAPLLTKELVLRRLGSASEILVDKNLILGSVEVLRNGVPDYAFSLDIEKGILVLANPAGLSEEIEVSYLRESAERRAGSLAAGLAGIFSLGESGSAWAALAGRLGLPGTSYAEGGKNNPGSLVLSAGIKEEGEKLKARLALAGSLATEEASGRYRIEDMEGSGSALTSFAPPGATSWPLDFAVEETLDTALVKDFPRLALELHRDGSLQRALKIVAPAGGGDIELAKILDPVPVEKLKSLVFFARRATAGSGDLEVRIDQGDSLAEPALLAKLSLADMGLAWSRFVFRYGEGGAALYRQAEEGGALSPVSTTVSYAGFAASPGRLLISLTGLTAPTELWLDEILLEDSRGRSALQAEGAFSYADPGFSLGEKELPLLSGIELDLDASAALHNSSYASGGLSLGTTLGVLGIEARLRGRAAAEGGAIRAGHSLVFPTIAFPLQLRDGFDYDPELGSFGREDGLSAKALGLSLELSQASAWTPSPSLGGSGLLLQEWRAKLGGGAFFGAELSARQRTRPTALALDSGYPAAWLSAFAYLLPSSESFAESRSIDASLSLGLLKAGTIARAGAILGAEPGSDRRRSELLLRLAAPLSLAEGLKLEPYYQRRWKEVRADPGSGLLDLASLSAEELASSPAWSSLPFAELGSAESLADFDAASSSLAEASYAPELGLSLARPYGSVWTDLLLPSALSLAYRRELGLEAAGALPSDAQVWEGRASYAALNLFGRLGSLPLSSAFATDDYLSSFQASLSLPAGGGAASWSFLSQQLFGFYAGASAQGGRLGFENRLALDSGPAESSWSEGLKLELVLAPERQWLLELFRLLSSSWARPQAGGESRLASGYLRSLGSATPRAKTILGLSATVTGKRSDAEGSLLDFAFEESYEARLSIPERLSASARAALSQEREGETGLILLGLSFGLSLNLSF